MVSYQHAIFGTSFMTLPTPSSETEAAIAGRGGGRDGGRDSGDYHAVFLSLPSPGQRSFFPLLSLLSTYSSLSFLALSCSFVACSIHFCLIFMGHLRRQRCAACLCIRKIHFRLTVRIRETALFFASVCLSVSVSVCQTDCIWPYIFLCMSVSYCL